MDLLTVVADQSLGNSWRDTRLVQKRGRGPAQLVAVRRRL